MIPNLRRKCDLTVRCHPLVAPSHLGNELALTEVIYRGAHLLGSRFAVAVVKQHDCRAV